MASETAKKLHVTSVGQQSNQAFEYMNFLVAKEMVGFRKAYAGISAEEKRKPQVAAKKRKA